MAGELERWVSGQLHAVLGLSERHVVAFMIGLAKRSRSPEDLLVRLEETETLNVTDPSARAFAQQLWERVSRRGAWARGGEATARGVVT